MNGKFIKLVSENGVSKFLSFLIVSSISITIIIMGQAQ